MDAHQPPSKFVEKAAKVMLMERMAQFLSFVDGSEVPVYGSAWSTVVSSLPLRGSSGVLAPFLTYAAPAPVGIAAPALVV